MLETSVYELLDQTQSDNFVFLGEAGCGKSEIAINFARELSGLNDKAVHFFDLDMTKPIFRSRDQKEALEGMGVTVHYEAQFMDAPTVTGGVRQKMLDKKSRAILDVGGDYIGARSIGGYAPWLNMDGTTVYYIINPFRPWSATIEHIDAVLGETLGVSHVELSRLRLIGNPNLGLETTPDEVAEGASRLADMVSPYKPVDFICVNRDLCPLLEGDIPSRVLPVQIYMTYPWLKV